MATPWRRKLDYEAGCIDMTHGSGGKAMAQLIDELFVATFDNPILAKKDDQALFDVPAGRMVMSSDGYVVTPLFFPGGDIGDLAVNGTVNDLAMGGAVPLHMTASFILEEGFPLGELRRIVLSMARSARAAGVTVVAGDTKVVERGKGDGVFITVTAIGVVPPRVVSPSGDRARPGDVVILSGTVGDHGIAILSSREGAAFETSVESDTAPLHALVAAMVDLVPDIHVLRDPTRGGVAATLNEIAQQSGVGIVLEERALPIRGAVSAACELLGLDPLHLANAGKLVAVCGPRDAKRLLDVMRATPLGAGAAIVGRVAEDAEHKVVLETSFGGKRVVDWAVGEAMPRLC
jgi:hydrogenase expression/formation protein HypE